jgi:hypothetical protein
LSDLKREKVWAIPRAKTLLDIDVGSVLEKAEAKYGLKLPRRVIAIDYGEDVGALFVRFRHVEFMAKVSVLDVEDLAKVLKRLSFFAQTKVYLFWKKEWQNGNSEN